LLSFMREVVPSLTAYLPSGQPQAKAALNRSNSG